MSEVIDLDALAPKEVTIKFDGQEIKVNPPTVADIIRLGSLGQEMTKVAELTDEESQKLNDRMSTEVKRIIPELQDKTLSGFQLMKLIEIINTMAKPPETKEMEAKKISGNSDPKDR